MPWNGYETTLKVVSTSLKPLRLRLRLQASHHGSYARLGRTLALSIATPGRVRLGTGSYPHIHPGSSPKMMRGHSNMTPIASVCLRVSLYIKILKSHNTHTSHKSHKSHKSCSDREI